VRGLPTEARSAKVGATIGLMTMALSAMVLASVLAQMPSSGTTKSGLAYEVTGGGEAVVLVHAFSVDRRMWEPQVAALEKRFRVVRYDLRGHGQSSPASEPFKAFDDLNEVLDTLKIERATVVGLSAGSEIAINFALTYPARVACLVLAAPGLTGFKTPPLPWFAPIMDAIAKGDNEGAAQAWAGTPIMALHTNTQAAATVTAMVMSNAKLWSMKRVEQPLTPPAIDRLADIKVPTVVIVGDQDLPHIREVAQLIVSRVSGARLVTIPGAGHLVSLDTPAAFNEVLINTLR
jgi:3-oxoadipate enol-lactonase